MPFPNKRIFYKPEQLMLGGIPEQLHQSIKSLAEQENHVQELDDNLFQQESDIRSCLNLGLEIYNLDDLIKEIHIYLDSLSQNTDYAQFIQQYLQTYIEEVGIPSVGENPTSLMREYCQSHQPTNRKRINYNQVSLLAALLSINTLLTSTNTQSNFENINASLKFLIQKYHELLGERSILEKMRQDLKSSIDQVFANQENIQTKPDIHLHTVEIQTLANAIDND